MSNLGTKWVGFTTIMVSVPSSPLHYWSLNNIFPFFIRFYGLGIECLCPMIPEIILPIPLKSSPIETNISIKTRGKLGYAYKIAEKPITIPPMIIFAMREPLLSFFEAIPFATRPTP